MGGFLSDLDVVLQNTERQVIGNLDVRNFEESPAVIGPLPRGCL